MRYSAGEDSSLHPATGARILAVIQASGRDRGGKRMGREAGRHVGSAFKIAETRRGRQNVKSRSEQIPRRNPGVAGRTDQEHQPRGWEKDEDSAGGKAHLS